MSHASHTWDHRDDLDPLFPPSFPPLPFQLSLSPLSFPSFPLSFPVPASLCLAVLWWPLPVSLESANGAIHWQFRNVAPMRLGTPSERVEDPEVWQVGSWWRDPETVVVLCASLHLFLSQCHTAVFKSPHSQLLSAGLALAPVLAASGSLSCLLTGGVELIQNHFIHLNLEPSRPKLSTTHGTY